MKKPLHFWISPAEAVLVITLILILIGLLNIFSASFVLASQTMNDSYFFLKKQLQTLAVGVVVLLIIMPLDYRRFRGLLPGLVVATIGLLIAVHTAGVEANGARRWLQVGTRFQPSEFAKLVAVMLTAAYLGPRLDRHRAVSLFSRPLLITLAMGYLVLKQPDMGTAAVIVAASLALYLTAGIPKGELFGLFAIGATGVVYLVRAAGYRAERVGAWLDPWAYQQTTGYQTVQSLLAIGSGGFFGTGIGMGTSKFYYLPEAHTDFAFAVLCQEMGFIGAILVLFLFALFGWYGIKIALKARDGFGMTLAAGMTILIVGQAIGNVAMVSGLLPVTGIPLPFISYGGTSLLANLAAVGILVSISRWSSAKKGEEETSGNAAPTSTRLRLVRK